MLLSFGCGRNSSSVILETNRRLTLMAWLKEVTGCLIISISTYSIICVAFLLYVILENDDMLYSNDLP